jgi:hypothetical protein
MESLNSLEAQMQLLEPGRSDCHLHPLYKCLGCLLGFPLQLSTGRFCTCPQMSGRMCRPG